MKIAVIGAGPAGLTAAIGLSRNHHEVTVFESRSKADYQGSGVLIQPVGLMALSLLGLKQPVIAMGRHIESISGIQTNDKKTIVAVDYKKLKTNPFAIGIDRSELWRLLYQSCTDEQVKLVLNTNITKFSSTTTNKYSVTDSSGLAHQNFDLVIDASGVNSQLTQYALKPSNAHIQDYGSLWSKLPLPKGCFFDQNIMQVFTTEDNVGIGVMPTGFDADQNHNMATVFFNLPWQSWDPKSFKTWKQSIITQWPNTADLLAELIDPEQLYLAQFKQHTLTKPHGDGIVYIGDAAHAANPQLGQGINMSLVDAVVLPWILQNSKATDLQGKLKHYSKLRRRHVWIYQTLAKILTPFYQSNNQHAIILRDAFYPFFNALPLFKNFVAYTLSGQLGQPLKKITETIQPP